VIVIILGPPGAGKGSQGYCLVQRYGLRHLSSGDLLRHIGPDSELGKKAQDCMDQGQLVPDELINEIMINAINQKHAKICGCLLDGYPRTLRQAEILDQSLRIAEKEADVVLNLQVEDAKLEYRVTGRRTCSKCDLVYHIEARPPRQKGVCDVDGEPLVQRPDDTVEVIRSRIEAYHQLTEPLVAYYEKCGNIRNVDGNGAFNEITEALFKRTNEVLLDV